MGTHDKKVATMAANLEAKTGRSLEAWLELLDAEGPSAPKAWQGWLKERGLGHFQARLVAGEAKKRG